MPKMNRAQNKYNKLSRSYRFKKKIGIVKKDDSSRNQIKKAKIIIRNISFKTSESDLQHLYEPFGEIEEIKLLKRPDGKLVGCGFVQFKNIEDASKAIFKTNKTNFLGRTISSEWAIPKSEFCENLKKEAEESEEIKEKINDEEANLEEDVEKVDNNEGVTKRKDSFPKKNALSKAEQRKLQKQRKQKKRSRIVLRNLPFTVTEEVLKEHFSKYGDIDEINILRKPDGNPTGCCFLQFNRVQSAAQAICNENMKKLLNRPIVVDWALPKDKYKKATEDSTVKTENDGDDEVVLVKEDKNENFNEREIKIKEEKDSDEEEIKDENESVEEESDKHESENDEEDEMTRDDNEDADDNTNIKLEADNESLISHPRRISNDVNEGKTVFIKNVPFSAKNEDLKECMEQFGPVYYALICIDRLTEHSKEAAFVKFRNVEDAEKCLAAGTELRLHDQILDPHRALHKNEINQKNEDKRTRLKIQEIFIW